MTASKPNYVLRFNEGALVPKKNSSSLQKLRPYILVVIAIILIASFVFGENLFGELSGLARGILLSLAFGTLFSVTDERVPKPVELWFFNEYLIIYRKHHFYSKKLSRLEYDKIYYKDISSCEFRAKTQRINIYGIFEGKWYDYNKDGSVSAEPSYHKTKNTICYFYTMFSNSEMIIKEIESHSPIRINRINN